MYVLIEKGKLVRERENDKYLNISPKKRSSINKLEFYKKSRKIFYKAKKVANFGLKKFNDYKGKENFIMGFRRLI